MKRYRIKTAFYILLIICYSIISSSCTTGRSIIIEKRGQLMAADSLRALSFLPRDEFGLIDWAGVTRRGLIDPVSSISDGASEDDEAIEYLTIIWSSNIIPQKAPININLSVKSPSPKGLNGIADWQDVTRRALLGPSSSSKTPPVEIPIIIKAKKGFMANAMFPHSVHTALFACKNCHPSIFDQDSWGIRRVKMDKIFKGEFCGRCHGKVAFPLRQCNRCHMEESKFEDTQIRNPYLQ